MVSYKIEATILEIKLNMQKKMKAHFQPRGRSGTITLAQACGVP
jgi:hypothetical protein